MDPSLVVVASLLTVQKILVSLHHASIASISIQPQIQTISMHVVPLSLISMQQILPYKHQQPPNSTKANKKLEKAKQIKNKKNKTSYVNTFHFALETYRNSHGSFQFLSTTYIFDQPTFIPSLPWWSFGAPILELPYLLLCAILALDPKKKFSLPLPLC